MGAASGRPAWLELPEPRQLSALERRLLREGFKVIARTQADLKEAYHVKVGRLF